MVDYATIAIRVSTEFKDELTEAAKAVDQTLSKYAEDLLRRAFEDEIKKNATGTTNTSMQQEERLSQVHSRSGPNDSLKESLPGSSINESDRNKPEKHGLSVEDKLRSILSHMRSSKETFESMEDFQRRVLDENEELKRLYLQSLEREKREREKSEHPTEED